MAKMISFKVYFWTNNMKEDGGYVPGKAWEHGVVHLARNKDHGIDADKEMFRHFEDIPKAIRKLARRNKLKIVRGRYSEGSRGRRAV